MLSRSRKVQFGTSERDTPDPIPGVVYRRDTWCIGTSELLSGARQKRLTPASQPQFPLPAQSAPSRVGRPTSLGSPTKTRITGGAPAQAEPDQGRTKKYETSGLRNGVQGAMEQLTDLRVSVGSSPGAVGTLKLCVRLGEAIAQVGIEGDLMQ